MIYNLLCLLEICQSSQQLVNLEIRFISFKAFVKFFEVSDFSQEVVDVGVELLDHIADRFFELSTFFLDPLLLDADFSL
jgi:hypothetical protein